MDNTGKQIMSRTNALYELFKCIVKLNPTRFKDYIPTTVSDSLVLIPWDGKGYDGVSRQYLEERIAAYAKEHPETGIILT